jgi:hypothetical protein
VPINATDQVKVQQIVADMIEPLEDQIAKAIVVAIKEDRQRPEARDQISLSPATVETLDADGHITVSFDTDPLGVAVPVNVFGSATLGQRGQVFHGPDGAAYFQGMTGPGSGGGHGPPPGKGPLFGSQDNLVVAPTSLTTFQAPTVIGLRRDDGDPMDPSGNHVPVGGGELLGVINFEGQTGAPSAPGSPAPGSTFTTFGSITGYVEAVAGTVTSGGVAIDAAQQLDSDLFTVDGQLVGSTSGIPAHGGGFIISTLAPNTDFPVEAARFTANGEFWQTMEGVNRVNGGFTSYWYDGVNGYPSTMQGPTGLTTIVGTSEFDSDNFPFIPFQSFATFRNKAGSDVSTVGTFQMGFSPQIVADGGVLSASGATFDSGIIIPPGSPTQQEDTTTRWVSWYGIIDDSYYTAINGGHLDYTANDGKSVGFSTLPVMAGHVDFSTRLDFWASEVAFQAQRTGNDPTLYRTVAVAMTQGNPDIAGNAPHPQFRSTDIGMTVVGDGIPPNTKITVYNPFFDAVTLSHPVMQTGSAVTLTLKRLPTIGRHIGYKVDALRAADNNRAISTSSPIQGFPDTYTHWAPPNDTLGAFVGSRGAHMYLDFPNAYFGYWSSWEGTVEFKQSGNPFSITAAYGHQALYKNARRNLVGCTLTNGSAVLSSRNGARSVSGPGDADFGPGDIGATITITHLFDVLTTTIESVQSQSQVTLATTWTGTTTSAAVATVTNTANFGPAYDAFFAPTFQADGAHVNAPGAMVGLFVAPTFGTAHGGTMNGSGFVNVLIGSTIGSGVTMIGRSGIEIQDAAVSGTLGSQFGIYIDHLIGAGESNPNIGAHVGAPLWVNVAHTETQDPVDGTQIGTPFLIDYSQTINYRSDHAGDGPFFSIENLSGTSWTNPYFTNPGTLGIWNVYGTIPDGPRALMTLEGTTQWNVGSGNAGGPGLFFTWYVFKNQPGVAANIGGNVMAQFNYQFIADNAHIHLMPVPDVPAPNLAAEDLALHSTRHVFGIVDNPFFGTKGANGHLDNSTGESIGFWSLPMFMGNTQWGTRYDFMAYEAHMNAGLAPQTGSFPTLGTHIGLYMQPFQAASKNISIVVNNGIQAFDVDRTYTVNPFKGLGTAAAQFAGLGSWLSFQNKMTLNYANVALGSVISFAPTIELQQSALSAGVVSVFANNATVQNQDGQVRHLAGVTTVYAAPTYVARNATISGGDVHALYVAPTYSVTGSGVFNVFTTSTAVECDLVMNAGAKVETRYGFKFNEVTGGTQVSPRVTNQYAIYIPQLTHAAGNYGILNASTTVWPGQVQNVTGAGTQILVLGTQVYMNNSTGSGIILGGSAPTLVGGQDGSHVTLINVGPNTVALVDRNTLATTGLALLATTVTLTQYQAVSLTYHGASGLWVQTSGIGTAAAASPTYLFRADGTINDITSGLGFYGSRAVGGIGTMLLRRANSPDPSALAVGNIIQAIQWQGYNVGTAGYGNAAAVRAVADEPYTTAGHFGGRLEFATSPIGSGTVLARTVIDAAGKLWHGSIVQASGVMSTAAFTVDNAGSGTFLGGLTVQATAIGSIVQTLQSPGTAGQQPIEQTYQGRVTTTTNAVATVATIPVNVAAAFLIEARVVARRTDATNTGHALGSVVVATVNGNTVSPSLVGNVATLGQPNTAFAAGFFAMQQQNATWATNTSYVTITISGGNALVRVTGVAGASLSWHATVRVWSVAT